MGIVQVTLPGDANKIGRFVTHREPGEVTVQQC
jgi:hypothetical protein